MHIKAYAKVNNTNLSRIAAKAGTSRQHMSNIANFKCIPSPELALVIEQATGGAVTRMELLYPELTPDSPTAIETGSAQGPSK